MNKKLKKLIGKTLENYYKENGLDLRFLEEKNAFLFNRKLLPFNETTKDYLNRLVDIDTSSEVIQ